MDGATLDDLLPITHQIRISKINREEGIVLLHGGAEKHRTLTLHQQFGLREEPCPFMIQTLWTGKHLVHITVSIKYGKRLSMFQDLGSAIGQRR